MPTLIINTNTPGSKVPQGFLNEATNVVAEMLGKPASFVAVRVHTDQVMSFGGTQDPCATVDLMCIGKMGPDVNDQHTVTIGNFIQSKLCIPLNRLYINFYDLERHNVGWNGKTFAK
ncbi:macrophage migration inhibitory factor-like [Liolophura sinensis]|uniref:macrophage migration inhibitory factor-like n=1 Tax=Liolophura sinensis TaxID=3198878 RepID=UPI0031580683